MIVYKSVWDFGREEEAVYGVYKIGEYPTKILPRVIEILIERFTKEGDTILDPFCGGGTVAIEAKLQGRNSINYDVNPKAIEITRRRLKHLTKSMMLQMIDHLIGKERKRRNKTNSRYEKIMIQKRIKALEERKRKILDDNSIYHKTKHICEVKDARELDLPEESVDAIITDIPYASMIKYSDLPNDLSNIEDYDEFLKELEKAFAKMWKTLKKGRYCVILTADYRVGAARTILPVHADVIQIMRRLGAVLFDIYVWRYYRSGGFRPFGAPPYQAMNVHIYILVFYKPTGHEDFLNKKNRPVRYRPRLIEKLGKMREKGTETTLEAYLKANP